MNPSRTSAPVRLEPRVRKLFTAISYPGLIRGLAWVPLLMTPPVVAFTGAFLMRRRGASGSLARHLSDSMLIACVNLAVSTFLWLMFGHWLSHAAADGVAAVLDLLRFPVRSGPNGVDASGFLNV